MSEAIGQFFNEKTSRWLDLEFGTSEHIQRWVSYDPENRRVKPTEQRSVMVTLFKPSGKYYTEEQWRVPVGAIGPYDMRNSPDFRRISGGAVLIDSQEPWNFPHLFPGEPNE